MQARHIARELALLSVSQLPSKPENLTTKTIDDMVIAAVRSLTDEIKDTIVTASGELQRGQDMLFSSETRASDLATAQIMVKDAIALTQTAINRAGTALEFPELIQTSRQQEVRDYVVQLLLTIHEQRSHIDELISGSLVDWQLSRLAQVDQHILRIATAEITYLNVPKPVAINEAVELAKRYSAQDGYRFINGVLRNINPIPTHSKIKSNENSINS
jgi:transcription antitermination protein NusB